MILWFLSIRLLKQWYVEISREIFRDPLQGREIAPPWSGTMSNPTPWPVTKKALKSVAN